MYNYQLQSWINQSKLQNYKVKLLLLLQNKLRRFVMQGAHSILIYCLVEVTKGNKMVAITS